MAEEGKRSFQNLKVSCRKRAVILLFCVTIISAKKDHFNIIGINAGQTSFAVSSGLMEKSRLFSILNMPRKQVAAEAKVAT